jgi:hypothetical protein
MLNFAIPIGGWPYLVWEEVNLNSVPTLLESRLLDKFDMICANTPRGRPGYYGSMSGGWPLSTQIKTRLTRWRRSYVKRRYANLFNEASAVLSKYDPIGINFEDNPDKYDPEVGTILPRLSGCHSSTGARKIVFEEFCKWFGPETAGDEKRYGVIAEELWLLRSAHRGSSPLRSRTLEGSGERRNRAKHQAHKDIVPGTNLSSIAPIPVQVGISVICFRSGWTARKFPRTPVLRELWNDV